MTIAVSTNKTATPTTIAVSTSTSASVTQTKDGAPTTLDASPSVGSAAPTPTLPTIVSPTPTSNKSNNSSSEEVIADATCVEFLHLMKAFSESAVNVTEMAQRVDSLVHQDEQLLRLLPLSHNQQQQYQGDGSTDDASGRGSTAGSVVDTTDDESSSSAGRARVDTESDLALALQLDDEDLDLDVDVDMDLDLDEDEDDEDDEDDEEDDDDDAFNSEDLDMLDDEDFLDESDGASTDAETRSISQRMGGSVDGEDDDEELLDDRERRAQEDLQRWMELELDLDSTEDPYDTSLHLPGIVEATLQTASASPSTTTTTPPKPLSSSLFGNVHAASLSTAAGSHANSSSVLSMTTALASNTSSHRFRSLAVSSAFDRKSVTAALFEDDDEDDDNADDDLVMLNALTRKKDFSTSKPSLTGTKRRLEDTQESKSEEDGQAGSMWGMEVDSYEQDLLSSIDHAVLCDRENRFLQWDLEIEAATAAAAAAHAAVSQKTELRTPPAALSTATTTASYLDVRQKMLTASSPRDRKIAHQPLRSPSNVDTNLSAEDWGSLDFGTFQNRTVSHILSSCLHKRKLHHPYKDRVTLVNFNVPGGEPIGPLPNNSATPSLAGSLLFGAGFEAAEALGKHGHGTAVLGLLSANGVAAGKDSKLTKSGEKKPKKPRADGERKKASHKSDPFADFDAFGDDVEARKLAMTKLENLPLPDLTNLPNDLKELKRKIEATEHKVEGTKHRHRKGGPCPRCQVQNQLRAAKRAYHKRAVAHKKLPQLGAVSPALTATAVVVAAPTPAPAATAVSTATVVTPPVSTTVSATVTPSVPATMATTVASITAALDASKASALKVPVAVPVAAAAIVPTPAPVSVVRPATVPVVKDAPPAAATPAVPAPVVVTAPAVPSLVSSVVASLPTTTPAVAMAAASAPFPRRSCGENALPSPFTTPSSVPSSSSSPSSPESSPPSVHHVTVTSA